MRLYIYWLQWPFQVYSTAAHRHSTSFHSRRKIMALLSTKALFLAAIIVVQATVFSPCPVQGIGTVCYIHFWHMFRITTMIITLLIFTFISADGHCVHMNGTPCNANTCRRICQAKVPEETVPVCRSSPPVCCCNYE
jgi:hypothetical protein